MDGLAAFYRLAALFAVQAPRALAKDRFRRAGAVLILTVLLALHGAFLSVSRSKSSISSAVRPRSYREHEPRPVRCQGSATARPVQCRELYQRQGWPSGPGGL